MPKLFLFHADDSQTSPEVLGFFDRAATEARRKGLDRQEIHALVKAAGMDGELYRIHTAEEMDEEQYTYPEAELASMEP